MENKEEKELYDLKGTKESIEFRVAAGHIKKCDCGKWVGSEHEKCGLCAGTEKAEKNLREIEKIKSEIKLKNNG